jgi:hypothetical protein
MRFEKSLTATLLSAVVFVLAVSTARAWDIGIVHSGMTEAAARNALRASYGKLDPDIATPNGYLVISASKAEPDKITDSLEVTVCKGLVEGYVQLLGNLRAGQAAAALDPFLKAHVSLGVSGPPKENPAMVFKLNDRMSLLLGAEKWGRFYVARSLKPKASSCQ